MNRTALFWLLPLALGLALVGCKKDEYETVGERSRDRFELLNKSIRKHIEDDTKKDQLLLLAEENRVAFKRIEMTFVQTMKKGRENPDIPREELEALLRDYDKYRTEQFLFMAQNRMKMRELMTREEWGKVFAPPKKKKGDKKEAEEAPAGEGGEQS